MNSKRIHFIGICGVAMSALALAFKRKGWTVTGSDVGFYPPISTYLKDNNVDYYPGWHPEKVLATFQDGGKHGEEIVVVGNVAGSSNPEWLYVKEHKLEYKSYPEVIRDYFVRKNSIVCAGTYGKSTSTALLTWILKEAGLNPTYMFGGLSQNDMPAAEITDSQWSVLEGDEYKASRWDNGPKFAYYSPTHLLLTAVIWDHADVYPTEHDYISTFRKLVSGVPDHGFKLLSARANEVLFPPVIDPGTGLKMLTTRIPSSANLDTYGKDDEGAYVYRNIVQSKQGLSFDIIDQYSKKTYNITSSCIGDYMADNITACFVMSLKIGIAPEKIIAAIASFKGMKRRLEKRFEGTMTIFDDIAHSGTKAKSVLETLKKIYCHYEQSALYPAGEVDNQQPQNTKLVAVFEPNTGNRRPQAATWYDGAFAAADEVIIPKLTKIKIDPTEELPFEGEQLATIINKTHPNVHYIDDDTALISHLTKQEPGTVIAFLGSHGFRGMIEELIKHYS